MVEVGQGREGIRHRGRRLLLIFFFLMGAAQGECSGIDIDLTPLSGNMLYAALYQMVNDPTAYAGKTVKLDGTYTVYETDDPTVPIHACIVRDAAGCCASGLEFRLAAPHAYPPDGSLIALTGTLALDDTESPPALMLIDATFCD